jgi:hypothetical protein
LLSHEKLFFSISKNIGFAVGAKNTKKRIFVGTSYVILKQISQFFENWEK